MVIDSSALIAYFRHEPGYQIVERTLLNGGVKLSSVNRTEIKGKLVGMGFATPNQINEVFDDLAELLESIPFDLEQSDLASFYYARRNPYNLSLGDCACLALAEALKEDILTAEHAWKKIPDLPFKVVLIRKHGSS